MLCTGAAWDSVLDFVKDSKHSVTNSTNWGNHYDSETYKVYRGSLYSNSAWSEADKVNGSEVIKGSETILTTGATERNCSRNIYDVAGNCNEWTTEAYSSGYRVLRGGSFYSRDSDCSCHTYFTPTYFNNNRKLFYDLRLCFRPILYVK